MFSVRVAFLLIFTAWKLEIKILHSENDFSLISTTMTQLWKKELEPAVDIRPRLVNALSLGIKRQGRVRVQTGSFKGRPRPAYWV